MHSNHQWRRDAVVYHAGFDCEKRGHNTGRNRQKRQAASRAAGLDRRASAAVRFLPERADHDRQGPARQELEPDRYANPRSHGEDALPLFYVLPRPIGHQARREGNRLAPFESGEGGSGMSAANASPTGRSHQEMNTFTNIPKQVEEVLEKWNTATSRRNFLKSSGLLVVSFSASPLLSTASAEAAATPQAAGGPYPDKDFHQLDSWIVIHEDNTATFYV